MAPAPRPNRGSCSGLRTSRDSTTAPRSGRAGAGSRTSGRSAAGSAGSRTGTSARQSAPRLRQTRRAIRASLQADRSSCDGAARGRPGTRENAPAATRDSARVRLVAKAGRELRQQRTELAGWRERIDGGAELVDVLLREIPGVLPRGLLIHARVRELLVQLERELEGGRRAIHPALSRGRRRDPVERRIDFDRVEVLGVEAQLVESAA